MELAKIDLNLEEIRQKAETRGNITNSVVLTNATIRNCEAIRTENNKFIKEVEKGLENARNAFLEPFETKANEYKQAIETLKETNERFSKEIIVQKKQRFKEEMEAHYEEMVGWGLFLPPFEEAYDELDYSKTHEEARKAFDKRIDTWQGKQKQVEAYLNFKGNAYQYRQLMKFAQANGMVLTDIEEN